MKRLQRPQRGFAAIAAIFLVVLLAALGAFMVAFSNTQQLTSAQDIQGSRAYWAARAGLEWGIAGVNATAPVSPATLPLATCPAGTPPSTVEGFTLTIICTPLTFSEAGQTRTLFRVQSTARTGSSVGSASYIERSLSAWVEYGGGG